LYGFYKGLSAPFFAQTLTTALAFAGDHLAIKILQVSSSSEYRVNIFYTLYLTHTYLISISSQKSNCTRGNTPINIE
jgi:hypothetical protein